MRDLVSLAERREAACKDEISTLLASRSTMYEATQARRACSQPAQAAQAVSPAAVAGPEAEAAAQEAAQVEDEGCEETLEAAAAKIDEAEKRMEVAQVGCARGMLELHSMHAYLQKFGCLSYTWSDVVPVVRHAQNLKLVSHCLCNAACMCADSV